jgi:hypothetical protein
MDPFTIAIFGAGLATSLIGAKKKNKVDRQVREQQEAQNQLSLEKNRLEALRATRDNIRRAQVIRATGLNAAANAGVDQGSSGVQGGLAQAEGQENLAELAISSNLGFAQRGADINTELGRLGGKAAEANMYSQIGGALMGNAQGISRVVSSTPQVSS